MSKCRICGNELKKPDEIESEECIECMFLCELCGSHDWTDSKLGNRFNGPHTYCPACDHWTDQWKASERLKNAESQNL